MGVCVGLCSPKGDPFVQTLDGDLSHLIPVLNDVFTKAAAHLPVHTWTSLQLNRNCVSAWHSDVQNVGLSLMLTHGGFSGGEFQVEGKDK